MSTADVRQYIETCIENQVTITAADISTKFKMDIPDAIRLIDEVKSPVTPVVQDQVISPEPAAEESTPNEQAELTIETVRQCWSPEKTQENLVDELMDKFPGEPGGYVIELVDRVISEKTPVPVDEPDEQPKFGDYNGIILNIKSDHEYVSVDRNGIDVHTGVKFKLTASQLAEFTKYDREQAVKNYDALVEQSQKGAEQLDNPYPVDAWEQTPYLDFAKTCQGSGKNQNYIPPEYFINGLMTVVGAICGNRIVPEFNQKMEARFITLLLSEVGGIGKNTVLEWSKEPFSSSNLIYTHGIPVYKKIGCYVGDFGSARGMLEKFMLYPRVLQEYGELSTAVEKFNIAGSGQAFRDQILNLADSQTPNWSTIKGMRVSADAPKEISNSLIAGTTNDRFEEMMMQSNWETMIQRMNIIPTNESRTVFKLVVPDLSGMQKLLMPKISLLEAFRFVWSLSDEAEEMAKQWHEQLQSKTEAVHEDVGRIQVYLFRVLGHMAFWNAPLPSMDAETDKSTFTPNGIYIPAGQTRDRIWSYEVGPELMKQAIKVAEYQITARRETMPVRGTTIFGQVENLIKKWAFKQKSMRWIELKRRSHIDRFGHKACHDSLMNLQTSGVIIVKANPEEPTDQRDWIVVWAGSVGKSHKWEEKRGGTRKGAGRKPVL